MAVINGENRLLSEIAHAEQILKKYRDEEQQSLELLVVQLASANYIVCQAQEKSHKIKQVALNQLQAQEARLLCLQKLMQQVYGDLADVRANLREINDEQSII